MYAPESRDSFFRDIALAQIRRDPEAKERLARHRTQMTVERAAHAEAVKSEFGAFLDRFEARANPSSVPGSGGEFDVPAYIISKFASAGRAGRPLGDLLQPVPLPPGISSIHIPRMTTGSQTTTSIDSEAVTQQDLVTTDVLSPVVTIDGQLDVSQQLYDMAPLGFDTYAFQDLTRAYNRNLEAQLLNGSGLAGQMLGLQNVTGINTVNGATGTTLPLLWPLLGQAAAAIGNNRLMPPEVWLLAIRRWFWMASSVDASNRPIASPGNAGPQSPDLPSAGGSFPVGPIMSLPAYLDGALPAQTNPDVVIACRPSDMFLFEGQPRIMAAANPTSGTLQIRLSLHRYAAFVPHRYPNGISVVTGIPAPAGF